MVAWIKRVKLSDCSLVTSWLSCLHWQQPFYTSSGWLLNEQTKRSIFFKYRSRACSVQGQENTSWQLSVKASYSDGPKTCFILSGRIDIFKLDSQVSIWFMAFISSQGLFLATAGNLSHRSSGLEWIAVVAKLICFHQSRKNILKGDNSTAL